MIEKHNTKQLLLAALYALMGLSVYVAGYGFLRFIFWFGHLGLGPGTVHLIIASFFLLVTFAGYVAWRKRGGLASYYDSGLYVELDVDSGGARAVEYYADRVVAPAYAISQFFMAGPLWLLRAWAHWRNRLKLRPGLNAELSDTFARLRAANKWQGLRDYPPSDHEAILLLGKIGLVDLSFAKGSPRFKAHVDHEL
jgi:hypothetical protein